ncbi:DUF6478 family protein, partial [Paracoccus binzhouensis]|uniref:DUF6478 family protein n=1 Tax=Paracoccus binzhouensis TaxID=2796149 RepID=UPI001E3A8351
MVMRPRKWIERKTRARALRHWRALAEEAEILGPGRLRGLREEALALRAGLDRFLLRADRRVARAR